MRHKLGCLSLWDTGSSAGFPECTCGMRWQVLTAGRQGPGRLPLPVSGSPLPGSPAAVTGFLSVPHRSRRLFTQLGWAFAACQSFCLKHLPGYFCPFYVGNASWAVRPQKHCSWPRLMSHSLTHGSCLRTLQAPSRALATLRTSCVSFPGGRGFWAQVCMFLPH